MREGPRPPRARRPWPILRRKMHSARRAWPPRTRGPWRILRGPTRRARKARPSRARRPWPSLLGNTPRARGKAAARAAAPAHSASENAQCARGKAAARAAALPHSLWGNTPCATGNAAGRAAALALCGIARSPRRARPQRFDCGGRRARGGAAELAALDVDAKGVIGLRKPRAHAARGRRAREALGPSVTKDYRARELDATARTRAQSRAHVRTVSPYDENYLLVDRSSLHICTHTIQTHLPLHARACVCIHMCVYIYMYVYVYVCIQTHMCIYRLHRSVSVEYFPGGQLKNSYSAAN